MPLPLIRSRIKLRRATSFILRPYTLTRNSTMTSSTRTYDHALTLLENLQSNRSVVQMVQQSHRDVNFMAIPEMIDWIRKAGYEIEDFNKLKVVHVSGTKGKGSVCAMAASILQQYSLSQDSAPVTSHDVLGISDEQRNLPNQGGLGKIGLYTSPHLVSVRERIRINNNPISQSLFATHFFTLWDRFSAAAAAAGHSNPTSPETKPAYFRYLTIMSLHVFLQEGVETAVVECGIGGEYDSTNILSKNAVTVTAISKLGIDHVGMLGDSIKKIAWHKAGIMKEGVECFTMPQVDEAMKVLHERAKEKRTVLNVVPRNGEFEHGDVTLGLEGDFQKDNASLAIAIAGSHLKRMGFGGFMRDNKLPAQFRKGLTDARWEGRCEAIRERNIEWCIDGAHTTDSLEVTAKWFAGKLHRSTRQGQAILIFNQQDRDASFLVRGLHQSLERAAATKHIFSHAVFCTNTPYRVPSHERSATGPQNDNLQVQRAVADAWKDIDVDSTISIYYSIEEAVEHARSISNNGEELQVLVTGSLHLVGGFLKVLKRGEAVL
jgi:folylpolyglutamate synthase